MARLVAFALCLCFLAVSIQARPLPHGWQPVDQPVQADQLLRIHAYLALDDDAHARLESLLYDVSNPDSPRYGRYLSVDQLRSMMPSSSAVQQHLAALSVDGRVHAADTGNIFAVDATVEAIQREFGVQLRAYRHRDTGKVFTRTLQKPTLHKTLAEHRVVIFGVDSFPALKLRVDSHDHIDTTNRDATPVSVSSDADAHTGAPTASSSAPMVLRLRNGDTQLPTLIAPRCKDGAFSTNEQQPCSDHGSALASFQVTFEYTTQEKHNETHTVSLGMCKQCRHWPGVWGSICSAKLQDASTVVCNTAIKGLRNYVPIVLSLRPVFADASTGDAFVNPVAIYGGQLATPASLRDYYRIPYVGSKATNNSMAVAEFLEQYYSPADMDNFLADNNIDPALSNIKLIGPNIANQPGGEATLDIEYIIGVAPGIETTFWSVESSAAQMEPFHVWMQQVLASSKTIYVHSVSYGDDEIDMTNAQMQALNQQFMAAGLRGMTILFASGDDGVSDTPVRTNVSECYRFRPSFPPTSPYVTAVGASMWSTHTRALCNQDSFHFDFKCSLLGEIVSDSGTGSGITSGGGFSDVFAMPDYQRPAVAAYLSQGDKLPPSKMFNKQGRAYPDLSAIGHNYITRWNGTNIQVDGTSASTPATAAMIALFNEARLARGLPPMGFINPWLYKMAKEHPEAFFDVTQGENRCSAFGNMCCPAGFKAAPGWDASTGIGTPRFDVLLSLAQGDRKFPAFQGNPLLLLGPRGGPGNYGPEGPPSVLAGEEMTLFVLSMVATGAVGVIFLILVIVLIVRKVQSRSKPYRAEMRNHSSGFLRG